METDDVKDFGLWMEPITHPPDNPLPNTADMDNEAEEMYSDYPADYCLPTTRQQSTPASTSPEEMNLEPLVVLPSPATTGEHETPHHHIKDRLNSSLPKKLSITKDRLLQSIGHVNQDKLIKLLPQLMKEDTIHIQMDSNP